MAYENEAPSPAEAQPKNLPASCRCTAWVSMRVPGCCLSYLEIGSSHDLTI